MKATSYAPDEEHLLKVAHDLMVSYMSQFDPSHDALHVTRVHCTAMKLAHSLPPPTPDLWIIEMAALLHDINDHKYTSVAQVEDAVSYAELLASMDPERAALLHKIIENVSWSKEQKKSAAGQWGTWEEGCRELWCVQDADRLDAIGAFGVMRCAAYSAVVKRPLHDAGSKDTAVAHFHDKLLKICGSLKTELGKKMGEKRHQFLLDFLAEIDEESQAA